MQNAACVAFRYTFPRCALARAESGDSAQPTDGVYAKVSQATRECAAGLVQVPHPVTTTPPPPTTPSEHIIRSQQRCVTCPISSSRDMLQWRVQ